MENTVTVKAKETYSQMNARIQEEVNKLPMYWAFSDSQWKGLLEKFGISEEEVSEKLMNGPAGSVILKKDKELIVSTLNRHAKELETAMQDMEFFKEAVIYEMGNHEYQINCQGDYDVLSALGFNCEYENEMERLTDVQKQAYKAARREYLKKAEENDWY